MLRLWDLFRLPRRVRALEEQNRFLLGELARLLAAQRRAAAPEISLDATDREQTRASFDFQWGHLPEGTATGRDASFMAGVKDHVLRMTALPASWFPGKEVADVGCGGGRFSRALLDLGARVTAVDQSAHALASTRELCASARDRLRTETVDLLAWEGAETYELVFCFGVVHHTGNTYRAIRNVARRVRPGGRLFLMVYGFPESAEDCAELNAYERLRADLVGLTFEDRKRFLLNRFGHDLAHGWFDAVSPSLNDLMTFSELSTLLSSLQFRGVHRTVPNRNLHVVAERIS